jgi:hypothetical protein
MVCSLKKLLTNVIYLGDRSTCDGHACPMAMGPGDTSYHMILIDRQFFSRIVKSFRIFEFRKKLSFFD